jgi:hypothetical protein
MKDLSTPTKLKQDKPSEEPNFSPIQVVSILVQNWFLMDPNLQIPKLENEDKNMLREANCEAHIINIYAF